jgi:hypothetical protein
LASLCSIVRPGGRGRERQVPEYLTNLQKGKLMRSHWHYRLAGLAAAMAITFSIGSASIGSAQVAAGPAAHASLAAAPQDCPAGTHWDDILHACI